MEAAAQVRHVLRDEDLDPPALPIDDPRLGQQRDLGAKGLAVDPPEQRTDSCRETGKSGLVTLVGSENVGPEVDALRSSGATGSPSTGGWGIVVLAAGSSAPVAGPFRLVAAPAGGERSPRASGCSHGRESVRSK